MGPDGAGRDGRLRRSDFIAIAQGAPSDYWEPARLGVFDAIIPDEGGDLRNLQLRQKRSQPTGQSGIQALHLECHREHHCGGRTCPSAACERAKTDMLFLSHPFTRMARRQGTRRTSVIPPQWRKDRGPSVTKIARYLGYGRRPSSGRGRGRDGLRMSLNHPDIECFRDVSETGVE